MLVGDRLDDNLYSSVLSGFKIKTHAGSAINDPVPRSRCRRLISVFILKPSQLQG